MNKLTGCGIACIPTTDLTSWIASGWKWSRSDGEGYEIVTREPCARRA